MANGGPRLEGDWPGYLELRVRKVNGGRSQDVADAVAVEHYLTIDVGGPVATLACTPTDLEDLVAGFLVGQGVLAGGETPEKAGYECSFSPDRRVARVRVAGRRAGTTGPSITKFIASGCGAGLVFDQTRVLVETPRVVWGGRLAPSRVGELGAALRDSPLFGLTGGTHSALAATAAPAAGPAPDRPGTTGDSVAVLVRREDLGRHNAVDKVIGSLWLSGCLAAPGLALAVTGRLSSDIVLKAARAGFPVVISHGAPTVIAVKAAGDLGLTLIGFARGKRYNVYSHPERVE